MKVLSINLIFPFFLSGCEGTNNLPDLRGDWRVTESSVGIPVEGDTVSFTNDFVTEIGGLWGYLYGPTGVDPGVAGRLDQETQTDDIR